MADNDNVDVVLSGPCKEGDQGDKVSLERTEAKRLIRAGYAVPATKPAAEALGVKPETAATARKD